jgi:hypothetical protein
MMTEGRIIEKDSWTAAQSTTGDEQAKTVTEIPPKLYKTGSMTIEQTFDKPGYFVGFVTVEKEGNKMTSRFPFSVGYGLGSLRGGGTTPYIYAGLALLIAAGGAFYYFRTKKANQVTV